MTKTSTSFADVLALGKLVEKKCKTLAVYWGYFKLIPRQMLASAVGGHCPGPSLPVNALR